MRDVVDVEQISRVEIFRQLLKIIKRCFVMINVHDFAFVRIEYTDEIHDDIIECQINDVNKLILNGINIAINCSAVTVFDEVCIIHRLTQVIHKVFDDSRRTAAIVIIVMEYLHR